MHATTSGTRPARRARPPGFVGLEIDRVRALRPSGKKAADGFLPRTLPYGLEQPTGLVGRPDLDAFGVVQHHPVADLPGIAFERERFVGPRLALIDTRGAICDLVPAWTLG